MFKHPLEVFTAWWVFSPKALPLQVFHREKREVSFGFAGVRENKCLWLPSDFILAFFSFHLAHLLCTGLAGTWSSALSLVVNNKYSQRRTA